MGKIGGWRVVLGGLVACVVLTLEQGIVQGGVLKEAWAALAKSGIALGGEEAKKAGGAMLLTNLCGAIILSWLYAAVRPRLGAGLRTALLVGLMVWGFMFFMSYAPTIVLLPPFRSWAVVSALGDLFGYLVAVSLAAWVYKEGREKSEAPARGRR
jgi:hypothetical protein